MEVPRGGISTALALAEQEQGVVRQIKKGQKNYMYKHVYINSFPSTNVKCWIFIDATTTTDNISSVLLRASRIPRAS